MAYRELELTLLSAQNLKNVNLITSMDVYAVVSISGDPLTRQSTAPDTYGGRNPRWNATFRFAVPPTAAAASAAGASLHVLLRAERFLGDRDVGEVVVPMADILAGAPTAGPQPTQVASYQVRKVHRWEPHGVLNVSYRLGPVVAPVLERAPAPDPEKTAAVKTYAPVDLLPAPRHPALVHVAEHEAAQKSPVMAYPVVRVPQQQSPPPAKLDAYRPPPPPPRPAAVREQAPAPAPKARNGRSNGHDQAGPTNVYMGPQTQIIFGGGAPTTTTTAGLPTTTTTISPPARPNTSPVGNWAAHGSYASATGPIVSASPRGKPSVTSWAQHGEQQASLVAGHRLLMVAAPPSSSRSVSASPATTTGEGPEKTSWPRRARQPNSRVVGPDWL